MKNGDVKHSKDLTEQDLALLRKAEEVALENQKRFGIPSLPPTTLEELKEYEGFYIMFAPKPKFGGDLKGPFKTEDMAREAHREWMWESKHS